MPCLGDLPSGELNRVPLVAPLSRNMSFAAVPSVEPFKRIRHFAKGEVVFRQGEQARGVFLIRRGSVKLYMTSGKGRAVILRIARAGEMLGLAATLSAEPYLASAETLEATELAYAEREQFLSCLAQDPDVSLSVARQACANYQNACRQVSLLGLCRSAGERVAHFILNWPSPVLDLTHEEIAQAAGTTRETVTRTLAGFRKNGWASLAASKLTIQSREALEKLVA